MPVLAAPGEIDSHVFPPSRERSIFTVSPAFELVQVMFWLLPINQLAPPLGDVIFRVAGASVTVHAQVAGDGSTLPAPSTAATSNVWRPGASGPSGPEVSPAWAHAPPSSRHWYVNWLGSVTSS